MRILLIEASGPIGTAVAAEYRRLFRLRFAFGVPALTAVPAIFWLMIARPEIDP